MMLIMTMYKCVCAIVGGGLVVHELRRPYGAIDSLYEALRTRVTGSVRL